MAEASKIRDKQSRRSYSPKNPERDSCIEIVTEQRFAAVQQRTVLFCTKVRRLRDTGAFWQKSGGEMRCRPCDLLPVAHVGPVRMQPAAGHAQLCGYCIRISRAACIPQRNLKSHATVCKAAGLRELHEQTSELQSEAWRCTRTVPQLHTLSADDDTQEAASAQAAGSCRVSRSRIQRSCQLMFIRAGICTQPQAAWRRPGILSRRCGVKRPSSDLVT